MEYRRNANTYFALASIQDVREPVCIAKLTVDIHDKNTTAAQAIGLVYEDALLSGSGDMSRSEFLDAVNRLGASISVNVSDGRVHISLMSRNESALKLIGLFKTMLNAPTFSTSELKRIKATVKNQLKEHEEDARSLAKEHFINSLYTKSDRRYTASPKELTIAVGAITRKDLRTFHTQVLNSYFVASIAANKKTQQVFERTIEAIKEGREAKITSPIHAPHLSPNRSVLHDVPSRQNIEFSIGGALPLTLHHPDYLPFVFGLSVLGKWGGFSGRLMSVVREKEGLTYGIYATTETATGTENGHWRIMTFFSPQQTEQGLTSTLREISLIHKKGITNFEYERFKNILKTQQMLLNDSIVRAVNDLHQFHTAGFTIAEMLAYKEALLCVTKKDINNAIKKYMLLEQIFISGAGPVSSVEKLLKKKFGCVKM